MNRRYFFFIVGFAALILAVTAVTAAYHVSQEPDHFVYLPLAIRPPDPQIIYFQAAPNPVDPGQMVTLSWEVQYADRVVLTRYWDFRPAEWWDYLPLTSTHTYTVPDWERNPVYFTLDAFNTISGVHVAAGVSILVNCPDSWFFNPPPAGCPTPALSSPAAEQSFAGGTMIWVGAEDRIIVLFADGMLPKVSNFTDDWDGEPICDLGPPPPGLLHPTRGFGKVWCEHEMVRNRLGWALEPETAYETILQRTTMVKYNHTYLRAADGNVWHLLPESSGWEKIVVSP